MADAALAGAVQVTLPPGAIVATSDLSFNFLRPVTVAGQQVVARARPIDVGRSLGLAEATIGADPILLLVAERRAATTSTPATVEGRPLAGITS